MTTSESIKNQVARKPHYGYKDWSSMTLDLGDTWPVVSIERLEEAFDIAVRLLNEQEEDNECLRSNIMSNSTAHGKYCSMLLQQINRLNDRFQGKDKEVSNLQTIYNKQKAEIIELERQLDKATNERDNLYNELYELKNK